MDKAKKNTVIHAAADRMAANYKSSQIPMYGDALRMPNRNAVIEIIRDCQKLIFPVYYGDRDLLKLPPEQYSALLMAALSPRPRPARRTALATRSSAASPRCWRAS